MQTAPAYSLFSTLAGPLVGLLVVAVAGYFVVMRLRRSYRSDEGGGTPFSLEDLRRLKREGKLTDDEYAKAHAMIVGAAKARLAPPDTDAVKDRVKNRDSVRDSVRDSTAAKKTDGADRSRGRGAARDRRQPGGAYPPTEIEILPEDPPPDA